MTTDELVSLLASAPDRIDAALAARPADASPATGEGEAGWSLSEILGHLCDSARYWGARMRMVLHEEHPQLEVFDQDLFVRLAAYRYLPAATLAQEFRLLSEANVASLRGLTPEQWQREGVHSERGSITLHDIVTIEVEHELGHARSLSASQTEPRQTPEA